MSRRRSIFNYWTAAITHWREEQRAAHHVERQGFEFYLPETLVLTSKGVDRREILFPGYIFIKLNDAWRSLAGTRGISRLLYSASELPAPVPTREINGLRAMEDERGFVQLLPEFKVGASVQGREGAGAFEGVRGIVRGTPARNRVRVLLSMMGRRVEVEFDRRVFEIA